MCATLVTCVDDCGNHNPSQCKGQQCGSSCQDTCGKPDPSCWTSCPDPVGCHDDCGNVNPVACSGGICDPSHPGFDTCGELNDNC